MTEVNTFIDSLHAAAYSGKRSSKSTQFIFKFLVHINSIYKNKKIHTCIWDRMMSEKLRRQTRSLIQTLESCGFIERKGKTVTANGRVATTFNISEYFSEILGMLKDFNTKNSRVNSTNISDRINNYNPSISEIMGIFRNLGLEIKDKKNKVIVDCGNYILTKRGKREGEIFDTQNFRGISVIDFYKEKTGLDFLNTVMKLTGKY